MAVLLKNFIKEPLLHFMLLGAVIFLAYSLIPKRSGNESDKIIITQGQIKAMSDAFTITWQRPPTSDELEGLVRDRVREEVYYREALALGLDKDDIIIRRRLRQKMEFIANDVAIQSEPGDEELSVFMTKHPELFHVDPHVCFQQIFLNAERRGNNLKTDVSLLLSELNNTNTKNDFRKMGDASLLPSEMVDAGANEVINQFGEEFSKQLNQLPESRWVGPVSSGYGIHLVKVGKRTEGSAPVLSDIKEKVRLEWDNSNRLEINEKFYQELLKNYSVTIESPEKTKEAK